MMNKLQNRVSQYASMLMQHGSFSSVQIMFERRKAVSWQTPRDPVLTMQTTFFFVSSAREYELAVRLSWFNDLFALWYVCLSPRALHLESICYSVPIGCDDRWI